MGRFLGWLSLVLVAFILVVPAVGYHVPGYGMMKSSLGEAKELAPKVTSAALTNVDAGYADVPGVDARLENKTDRTFVLVRVSWEAFDADGGDIGTCSTTVWNFKKGTRSFKALCSGDDVKKPSDVARIGKVRFIY